MRFIDDELDERVTESVNEADKLLREVDKFLGGIERVETKDSIKWIYDESGANVPTLLGEYEIWYNSAYPLVNEYLPERTDRFVEKYDDVRRCLELDLEYFDEKNVDTELDLNNTISRALFLQKQLVSSIPQRAEIEQYRKARSISSEITSEEVQRAKELYDDEDIRAAGVICGVAIERHLITLCESSNEDLEFEYLDGIYSLAQTLHTAGEISDDLLRLLEYIAGIRNKCSHASEEEPEVREVERMLQEADEIIRQR